MNKIDIDIEKQILKFIERRFHREELILIVDYKTLHTEMTNECIFAMSEFNPNAKGSDIVSMKKYYRGIPIKIVHSDERILCVAIEVSKDD